MSLRYGTVTSTSEIPAGTPVDIRWLDTHVRLTTGTVEGTYSDTEFGLRSADLKWCQNIDITRWDVRALIGSVSASG
jgi:hypothetical protein